MLDECLPRALRQDFIAYGHEVKTVPEMSWASWKNGELLAAAAAAGFQALLTMDKGIGYQQNLTTYPIPILAFRARRNDVNTLRPLVPRMLEKLAEARAGQFLRIGEDSTNS